jgi:hypothetical protein
LKRGEKALKISPFFQWRMSEKQMKIFTVNCTGKFESANQCFRLQVMKSTWKSVPKSSRVESLCLTLEWLESLQVGFTATPPGSAKNWFTFAFRVIVVWSCLWHVWHVCDTCDRHFLSQKNYARNKLSEPFPAFQKNTRHEWLKPSSKVELSWLTKSQLDLMSCGNISNVLQNFYLRNIYKHKQVCWSEATIS